MADYSAYERFRQRLSGPFDLGDQGEQLTGEMFVGSALSPQVWDRHQLIHIGLGPLLSALISSRVQPREATGTVHARILNEIEKCVNCIAKKIQLRCELSGSNDFSNAQFEKFASQVQKVLAQLLLLRLLCSHLYGMGARSVWTQLLIFHIST
jgi:hypothetical protein